MNQRPSREETLYFAAAEMATPEMRAAFLERECAGDAALRVRVEDLLAKSKAAGAFFGDELEAEAKGPTGTAITPITEKAGDTIGRYKLLQQIGEGGCGVVYMAEQSVPVRRRVALKVIKLGMDTRQVIARFEAERQALAMMDHLQHRQSARRAAPRETGQPYLRHGTGAGHPRLPSTADQQPASPPTQRLELFIQVCAGHPARPSEGDYPSRHQALEHPRHAPRRRTRCPR